MNDKEQSLSHDKRHRAIKFRRLGSILLAVLFLCLGIRPLSAQANTVLSVSPANTNVGLNTQVILDLILTDAVNVNAFDIIVEYDDAFLRLDGWASGGFLSNLAVVVKTDNPGYFRLVCTQLATPPASGNGSLVRLTFYGLALGQSDISLSKGEFADSQGIKTNAVLEAGRVFVVAEAQPSFTPTATSTQPPPGSTATFTLTPTRTATLTQTVLINTPNLTTTAGGGNTPTPTRSQGGDPYPAVTTTITSPLPTQPAAPTAPGEYPGLVPTAPTGTNPTQAPPPPGDPEIDASLTPGPSPTMGEGGSGQPDFTPEATPGTILPIGTAPLRNTDPASQWQPGEPAKDWLPWIVLGVEGVALVGLIVWLLIRRRRC